MVFLATQNRTFLSVADAENASKVKVKGHCHGDILYICTFFCRLPLWINSNKSGSFWKAFLRAFKAQTIHRVTAITWSYYSLKNNPKCILMFLHHFFSYFETKRKRHGLRKRRFSGIAERVDDESVWVCSRACVWVTPHFRTLLSLLPCRHLWFQVAWRLVVQQTS